MRSRSRSKQVLSGSGASAIALLPEPLDTVAPLASSAVSSCSLSSRFTSLVGEGVFVGDKVLVEEEIGWIQACA